MVTKSELQEFLDSNLWVSICEELKERQAFIIAKLIQGSDQIWNDDNMRGRISELEFMETLPEAMLTDILLAEKQLETQKNEDSIDKEIE